MNINEDKENWAVEIAHYAERLKGGSPMNVKRSDINIFTNPNTCGLIALPAIDQRTVSNDKQLYAAVKANALNDKVVIIGQGWMDTERFVAEMTVAEFEQHWKGD